MTDPDDWTTMTNRKYQYVDPTTNGYRKVTLTRKQHNELFVHRPTNWKQSFEYYLAENSFKMHRFVSLPALILSFVLFPFVLIGHGLFNFKEIIAEYKKLIWQKEFGGFVEDGVWKSDKNDLFDRVVEQVRKNES